MVSDGYKTCQMVTRVRKISTLGLTIQQREGITRLGKNTVRESKRERERETEREGEREGEGERERERGGGA